MKTINRLCVLCASAFIWSGCNKPDPKVARIEMEMDDNIFQLNSNLAILSVRCDNQDSNLARLFLMETNPWVSLGLTNPPPAIHFSGPVDPDTGLPLAPPNAPRLDPNTGLPVGPSGSLDDRMDALATTVSNLILSLNHSHNSHAYAPAQSTSLPGQMPADVLAQIKADAAAMYPTDFEMQNFHIKQQTEAWYKLHGQQGSGF